jgi:hypothetical protein
MLFVESAGGGAAQAATLNSKSKRVRMRIALCTSEASRRNDVGLVIATRARERRNHAN